jgi:hypothetical protein
MLPALTSGQPSPDNKGNNKMKTSTVGATMGVPITLTGGASYKVPATYLLIASGFFGTPIAEGALVSVAKAASMGLALNASKTVIVPISLSNTSVLPML